MKNILFVSAFAATLFSACGNDPKPTVQAGEAQTVPVDTSAGVFRADLAESTVRWEGYEGFSVGNPEHFGKVPVAGGEVRVKEGVITGGRMVIDIQGLTVEDIAPDSPKNAKLRGHLINEDFFDTAKFPQGIFEIINTSPAPGDSVLIKGNLTLKGVTKSISFPVKALVSEEQVAVSAKKFYINRKDWGINYRSEESLGDEMIRPEIGIEFSIVAKR